jgi:[acyl-carrier-protein] S-malonyltransferase
MESFASNGITGMMELAPAGALAGLAKRGLKGVPTVAINSPDDIAQAVDMVAGA